AATQPSAPSLHDALPISYSTRSRKTKTQTKGLPDDCVTERINSGTNTAQATTVRGPKSPPRMGGVSPNATRKWYKKNPGNRSTRSEEHTSELQSRENIVC